MSLTLTIYKKPCIHAPLNAYKVYTTLSISGVIMKERLWQLTKKSYTIHAEIPTPIYDAVLRILESGTQLNISEYMGDLIKKDVEERGIELAPMEDFGGEGISDVIKSPVTFETIVVSTRVPIIIIEMINVLLDAGLFLRVSDYLRYIIKKDLEFRGIKPRLMKVDTEEGEPAKKWRPSETATVSTLVPMVMLEDIERLLESGFYLRVSDYLIDLIRKDLEARGVNLSSP